MSGNKIRLYLLLIIFGFLFILSADSLAVEVPKEIFYKSVCYPSILRFKRLDIEVIEDRRDAGKIIDNVLTILKDKYNRSITGLKIHKYISNMLELMKLGPSVCQAGPGSAVFLVSIDFNEKVQIPFISDFRKEIINYPSFSELDFKSRNIRHSPSGTNDFVFAYEFPNKNWPEVRILKVKDSVLIFYYLYSDDTTVSKILDKIK